MDALNLPFPEAIAALKKKLPTPSTGWKDYSGQAQEMAFTVSQITSASLLADIQALVIRNLEQGVHVDQFKKDFGALLDKSGWNLANLGYRAELVMSQNLRTAYSRGRWTQLQNSTDKRPYLEWRHRDSRVPRPQHVAQDGNVYPADAEVWKAIFPNPWGCKCTAYALSGNDLQRLNLKVSQPPDLEEIREPGFGEGFSTGEQLKTDAVKRLPPEFGNQIK